MPISRVFSSRLVIAVVCASFAIARATTASAIDVITTNFTQTGGVYTINPPDGLFVTHGSNNPLFTLADGATTSGITGFVVGEGDGESGRLRIEGGSVLSNTGDDGIVITIGPVAVRRGRGYLGLLEGSYGEATITGAGSEWINEGRIYVGEYGDGSLTIENGGFLSSAHGFIGTRANSVGSVTVSGVNSQWEAVGDPNLEQWQIQVGAFGNGTLLIEEGGVVSSYANFIGASGGSVGAATVTGVGSQLISTSDTHVGFQGEGSLIVENGGTVTSNSGYIGTFPTGSPNPFPGGDGHVVVRDAGSAWNVAGSFAVGWRRIGVLDIENGGTVTSGSSVIGAELSTGQGEVTVTGTGSTWTVNGDLFLGGWPINTPTPATGLLTVADGGTVEVAGTTVIHGNNPSTINLNAGGTLIVNHFDPSGGTFNWTGGSLVVNGDYQGDRNVAALATLSGTGEVQGNLTNAGLVTPGLSPGILTVTGDFTQSSAGETLFEIGGLTPGSQYDVLNVGGAVSLDGLISVALIDSFNPQFGDSFSVLSFDSFTDNGFAFDFSMAPLGGSLEWDTSMFSTNGSIMVVPEPAGPLLCGLGFVSMLFLRRRRAMPTKQAGSLEKAQESRQNDPCDS